MNSQSRTSEKKLNIVETRAWLGITNLCYRLGSASGIRLSLYRSCFPETPLIRVYSARFHADQARASLESISWLVQYD